MRPGRASSHSSPSAASTRRPPAARRVGAGQPRHRPEPVDRPGGRELRGAEPLDEVAAAHLAGLLGRGEHAVDRGEAAGHVLGDDRAAGQHAVAVEEQLGVGHRAHGRVGLGERAAPSSARRRSTARTRRRDRQRAPSTAQRPRPPRPARSSCRRAGPRREPNRPSDPRRPAYLVDRGPDVVRLWAVRPPASRARSGAMVSLVMRPDQSSDHRASFELGVAEARHAVESARKKYAPPPSSASSTGLLVVGQVDELGWGQRQVGGVGEVEADPAVVAGQRAVARARRPRPSSSPRRAGPGGSRRRARAGRASRARSPAPPHRSAARRHGAAPRDRAARRRRPATAAGTARGRPARPARPRGAARRATGGAAAGAPRRRRTRGRGPRRSRWAAARPRRRGRPRRAAAGRRGRRPGRRPHQAATVCTAKGPWVRAKRATRSASGSGTGSRKACGTPTGQGGAEGVAQPGGVLDRGPAVLAADPHGDDPAGRLELGEGRLDGGRLEALGRAGDDVAHRERAEHPQRGRRRPRRRGRRARASAAGARPRCARRPRGRAGRAARAPRPDRAARTAATGRARGRRPGARRAASRPRRGTGRRSRRRATSRRGSAGSTRRRRP